MCTSTSDDTVGRSGIHTVAIPPFHSVACGLSFDSAAEKSVEGDDAEKVAALFLFCPPKKCSLETIPVNSLQKIYADYEVKRQGHSRRFFPGTEAKT